MIGEVPSADGVPVRYEVLGSGVPDVVLVHGWSCDRSYWSRQVGHLAGRFTVVTVDLAGHGDSGTGRQAWTMASFGEEFVAATRAFVRTLFPAEVDRDLVEGVAADMAAAPPEIALDAMQHAMTNEAAATAGLHEAGLPAIAINPGWRPTDVESLARHGVRALLMPGVGHFLIMEDPARFNRLLDEASISS